MTLHVLNDVANDAESIQNQNFVIIASLKSETLGQLINRILDIKFTRLDFENAC